MILSSRYRAYITSPLHSPLQLPISSFSVRINLNAEQRSTKIHSPQGSVEWAQYMKPVVSTYAEVTIPTFNLMPEIVARMKTNNRSTATQGRLLVYRVLGNTPDLLASVPTQRGRSDEGSRKNSVTISGDITSTPWGHNNLPTKQVNITNISYLRIEATVGVRCGLNNIISIGEMMMINGMTYRVTQLSQWVSEIYGSMELTSQPISFGYVKD